MLLSNSQTGAWGVGGGYWWGWVGGRGWVGSRGLWGLSGAGRIQHGGPGEPHLGQQLWGPGSEPGHAPTLSPLSQYSAKLEQELQNLKVDMERLDLLSPAGLRDLQALQSSGLSNIHYPGFLIQVSGGPLRPDRCRTEGPVEELEGCIPPCPGPPSFLNSHVPGWGMGGRPQTTCPRPVLVSPSCRAGVNVPPTPECAAVRGSESSAVANDGGKSPLPWVNQRAPHFFSSI